MAILITKYKTGVDFPPLTTSLNHLSGENSLTFPYKSGDGQHHFSEDTGVHLCLINGGSLILTDDTDTFSVSFGGVFITVTWHSRTSSLADTDDVVFVFNAFAKPTSGLTRLKFVAASGQTVFQGIDEGGTALTLANSNIQVFKNDNFLEDTDYGINTTDNILTLVPAAAAALNDIITIFTYESVGDIGPLNDATISATASATEAGNHRTTAQRWATNPVGAQVFDVQTGGSSNDYSAKAYAIGYNHLGGSAKEWAIGGSGILTNPVEGSHYSAKYYATQGNVGTVATNMSNIQNVSTNISNINAVHSSLSNISAVASVVNNNTLQTVLNDIAAIQTTADDLNEATSEIDTVANSIANVDLVGTNIGNVNTVAGLNTAIGTVNSNSTNINIVASANTNITSVAGSIADVNTVAGLSTAIGTVNSNSTNINTVSTNINNVNSVGSNISAITTINSNLSNITSASANVTAFNQIYLGASSTAPTQDPDGSSLNPGDLYFNTTTNKLNVRGTSAWQETGSSVNGTARRFHYAITSAVSSVTGVDEEGQTLAYDAGYADVYVNGIRMSHDDIVITSGDTVTFIEALSSGDVVDIVAFGTFNIDVAITDAASLSTGVIPDARFPSTLPAIGGASVTDLNASNLASGTIPDARFPATLPAISGANLTGLGISGIVSTSSIITKPSHPAFQARTSGQINGSGNHYNNANFTVPFSDETFDRGNNYDNTTYTFTAPITGIYSFTINIGLQDVTRDANYYRVELRTTSQIYRKFENLYKNVGYSDYETIDFNVLTEMTAGNTAFVTFYQLGSYSNTNIPANDATSTNLYGLRTFWTGHLVC